MSGFKRYQSKVFWGQMESLDVGSGPMVSSMQRPQPQFPVTREDEEIFSLSGGEENLDSVHESDTTDPENTTVIHIEMCDSPARSEAVPAEASLTTTTTTTAASGDEALLLLQQEAAAERSFSPASRGQRSQDSGFSDSGRSDTSSGTAASGAPLSPRRRRRRRSSRRSRGQPRGPLAGHEAPGPAHTSTPIKRGSGPVARPKHGPDEIDELSRQLNFSLDGTEEEVQVAPGIAGISNDTAEEETLGDFLYASEPPEEEQPEPAPRHYHNHHHHQLLQQQPQRQIRPLDPRAPVKAWLEELRSDVEDECMATLQSKSLPRRRHRELANEEPESRDLRLLTASATTAAKKIIDAAERFDKRYQHAVRSISSSKSSRLERDLLHSIEAEAAEILVKLGSSPPRRIKHQENQRNIAVQLGRLKNKVDRALDDRLDLYIEKVVRGLEEAPREGGSAARGALAALTALGLAGPRAGASVARCSGIRALLTSLVSAARLTSELRASCLRALASVCCCLEAIDQFVREAGPDILAEVLAGPGAPHAEKSEAAALLVQITAPWMDRVALPYVEPFGQELVQALTDLAERTSCKQTLLLAAAGINHLSHSRRCIAAIISCDSIKKLLRCVKKSSGRNVWLMEQVAALVGQVARVPQARAHLAETRASVALVCFLRMQPPGLEAEYRRLEATAREALTRLCVDPEIAKQVVAVGGSDCLPTSECSGQACAKDEVPGDSEQMFRSTKSLRVARKIAAEQIDIAKIWDCSPR